MAQYQNLDQLENALKDSAYVDIYSVDDGGRTSKTLFCTSTGEITIIHDMIVLSELTWPVPNHPMSGLRIFPLEKVALIKTECPGPDQFEVNNWVIRDGRVLQCPL